MPINMQVEFPKIQNENTLLRYKNTSLIKSNKDLQDAIKQFIHAVDHEGVVQGRVVDALKNGKLLISNSKKK